MTKSASTSSHDKKKNKVKLFNEIFATNQNDEDPEDEFMDSIMFMNGLTNDEDSMEKKNDRLTMRSQEFDLDLTQGRYSGSSIRREDLIDEDDGNAFRDLLKNDKQYAQELQKVKELMEQERPLVDDENDDINHDADIISHLEELEEDTKNEVDRIKKERIQEKQKAHSVFNQKLLYNHLLKIRILIQKPLSNGNRLPQADIFDEMVDNIDKAARETLDQTRDIILETMQDFLSLQNSLFAQSTSVAISSDSDETLSNIRQRKKRRLEAAVDTNAQDEDDDQDREDELTVIWNLLQQQYQKYASYRDESLERWNRKTRLQSAANSKRFRVMNASIVDQVKQAIKVDDRLTRRCQVKRFEEKILGKRDREELESKEDDIDEEIFDDRDFYQTLLRDLIQDVGTTVIDPSTSHINPNANGSIRNALARSKASEARRKLLGSTKGRTIKYNVHSKLVGFMAPIELEIPTSADTLFKNLFGGNTVPEHLRQPYSDEQNDAETNQ